jgi:hypothetical protein
MTLGKAAIAGPGVPFLFKYSDYRDCSFNILVLQNHTSSVPIFSLCSPFRARTCNYTFPLPTYSMIDASKEKPEEWDLAFAEDDARYPWHNKTSMAVWRGTSSGTTIRKGMLAESENTTPDTLFDFGFTHCPRCNRNWVKDKLPFDDFLRYGAIFDVDGNSWSERFGRLLCRNSVVVRIVPEYVDYFSPELQPWVHYVPVKLDMPDLANTTRYVLDHGNQDEMQAIVANARCWCRSNYVTSELSVAGLDTLSFYVDELDRNDPSWTQVWRESQPKYIDPVYQWYALK